MSTRQAILRMSRETALSLLPPGRGPEDLDGIADVAGDGFGWLARALRLPAGARVTGVSTALRFGYDEVCFRIGHPDFAEVPPGNMLPEVEAFYRDGESGELAFRGYGIPATPPTVKFREFL